MPTVWVFGVFPGSQKILLVFKTSVLALGPTHLSIHWVWEAPLESGGQVCSWLLTIIELQGEVWVQLSCTLPVLSSGHVQGQLCRYVYRSLWGMFSLFCCSKNQRDWRLGISWAAALHWKGWGAWSLSTTAALQICTGGAWMYDSTWVQVTHQGSEQHPWGWICTLWSQTGTCWWLNTPGGVAQRWSSSWSKCVQISSVLECNCVQYCVECLHMQKVTVDIIRPNLLHLLECTILRSSDDKSVLKW